NDFTQCRSGRSHTNFACPHRATRVKNQLLTDLIHSRANVAQAAQTTGLRVDLRFQELIANAIVAGQRHPRCCLRGSKPSAGRQPSKTECRYIDDGMNLAVDNLASMHRFRARSQRAAPSKLNHDSPSEAAWV